MAYEKEIKVAIGAYLKRAEFVKAIGDANALIQKGAAGGSLKQGTANQLFATTQKQQTTAARRAQQEDLRFFAQQEAKKTQILQHQQQQRSVAINKYRTAMASGDIATANSMLNGPMGGMIRSTSVLPTAMQRFGAAMGQSGGGYGKYVLAGVLGGRAGITGLALGGWGKEMQKNSRATGSGFGAALGGIARVAGAGVMIGGILYTAAGAAIGLGRAAIGAAKSGANMVGLNQDTFQSYADFNKNIQLAALNLKATATGAFDMKNAMDDFSATAKSLATKYGGAVDATGAALLLKRATGLGNLTQQQVKEITETSIGMSMVSENTSPEQSMQAIASLFLAGQNAGIKNLKFNEIGGALNMAGILSPTDVGAFSKNIGNYSAFLNSGGSITEGLVLGTLLQQGGMTGARAGTQLASIKQRMPGIIANKGLDAMLLGSSSEANKVKLSNMNLVDLVNLFRSQAKKENLILSGEVSGDANNAKKKLDSLDIIFSSIIGLRGGTLMNTLKTSTGSEEGMTNLQLLFDKIGNAGEGAKTMQDMIDTLVNTPVNKVDNAKNALQNLQMEVMGIVAPFIGAGADRLTIAMERARLTGLPDSVYKKNALTDLDAREASSDPNGVEAMYAQMSEQYAGTIYAPFVDIGKKLYDIVSAIDENTIRAAFEGMGNMISSVISWLSMFSGALSGMVQWMSAMGIIDSKIGAQADLMGTLDKKGKSGVWGQMSPDDQERAVDLWDKYGKNRKSMDEVASSTNPFLNKEADLQNLGSAAGSQLKDLNSILAKYDTNTSATDKNTTSSNAVATSNQSVAAASNNLAAAIRGFSFKSLIFGAMGSPSDASAPIAK